MTPAAGFAIITPREASILAALADAAAAPEPPLPPVAATDAAAAFDAWLAAAPRRNRLALRGALLALERLAGRRRFRSRDRAGRLAVLRRLQRSRVPIVPQLAEALRSAAVLSYHGDARRHGRARATTRRRACGSSARAARGDDGGRRRDEDGRRRDEGAAGGRGDGRRAAPAAATRRDGRPRRRRLPRRRDAHAARGRRASSAPGAGGAVVAKELAEGGARVVVLEEGGRHEPRLAHRPPARHDGAAVPRRRAARHARAPADRAAARPRRRRHDARQLRHLLPHSRPRARALAQRSSGWTRSTPDALAPVFDRVERTLGVAEVPAELAGANAALMRRGAERLGWSGGYLRRNARGCQGSGVCAFGCPTGAKQHAGDAYLAPARAAGALDLHRRARAADRHPRPPRDRRRGAHRRRPPDRRGRHGRRRRRHDPHAAAARREPARRPLGPARREPQPAPGVGGLGAVRRARRHGARRAAVVLRGRVRRRRDHARGDRRPARLPGAGGARSRATATAS